MSTSDQNNAEDFAARINAKGCRWRRTASAKRLRFPMWPCWLAWPTSSSARSRRRLSRLALRPPCPILPMPARPLKPGCRNWVCRLPSVPAIPSAGKFPAAPDMAGTELSPFTAPGPGQPRLLRPPPLPSRKDRCSMTPEVRRQRFRHLPSRFRCPSLTMRCFRPSTARRDRLLPVCPGSRPFPHCGRRTMLNQR